MEDYDVVVVGGGPAGLCAGLYAGRAKLKTVVLEKGVPGGQIVNTGMVDDYPGFEEIMGPELAQKMEEHCKKFGAEIRQEEVLEVYCDGDDRITRTDENEYRSKVVILSAGGSPNYLEIPGEKEFWGKGVSYCAICDGAFFQDEVIAVIGGGDAAVEEATFLTKFGSKVYVIHRRDELRAQKIIQDRAFKEEKLDFIWNTVVDEIVGDNDVKYLKLRNVKTGETSRLDVGGVFIFIGFTPNSGLVREALERDESGYIKTDQTMLTNIKGIYAVGDVRTQVARQLTTAVGDATTAAVAAEKYIESLKDAETASASSRE
ncbi:MAG: thioredoxin-disulfide reductase [Nitrospinota bacterium]